MSCTLHTAVYSSVYCCSVRSKQGRLMTMFPFSTCDTPGISSQPHPQGETCKPPYRKVYITPTSSPGQSSRLDCSTTKRVPIPNDDVYVLGKLSATCLQRRPVLAPTSFQPLWTCRPWKIGPAWCDTHDRYTVDQYRRGRNMMIGWSSHGCLKGLSTAAPFFSTASKIETRTAFARQNNDKTTLFLLI